MDSNTRYMKAVLEWYKDRRRVLQVDWKLLIGAILIMGFFIFVGVYFKDNIVNEDLGTILLMGVPMLGGMFAGKILPYTFSIGWGKKKKCRKEDKEVKDEN